MAHIRAQLREAIVTALDTVPGISVFKERVYNYSQAQVPAISVYTSRRPEQQKVDLNTQGGIQARVCSIVVEIRDKAAADIDDVLDGYCVSVEKKMAEDNTFGAIAITSELSETEFEITGESDQLVGLARLTYDVLYMLERTDPEEPVT